MLKMPRDPFNGWTHCAGAILSVIGLIVLIVKSIDPIKPWHLVTFSVFGAGLTMLYTSSALYHWIPLSEKGIRRMRRVDHMMIFVLIAATYTPICLIPLRGPWGWSLFSTIWGLALVGMILKIFWLQAPRWFSTSVYVLMGWVAIVGVIPLVKALNVDGFLWIVAGGLFYTVGAIVYALKRPDPWPHVVGFHEIFHIFVMLGSVSHYWVMYHYVAPFA